MLITEVKKKENILPFIKGKVLLIACLGCKEVHFPEKEYKMLKTELKTSGVNIENEITLDYLCNEDYTKERYELHKKEIAVAETVIVFSCGVGVQVLSCLSPDKKVIPGCDSLYVPGFSGFTPSSYDCGQCGECVIGITAGICPVKTCSKGLLNGQCGGAKKGKCEVSKNKDCGWEKIYNRMTALKENDDKLKGTIKIRNYNKK